MVVYHSVSRKIKTQQRFGKKLVTRMIENAEESKKIKDFIYSLYKRNLITLQRYVHILGLIEDEQDIEVKEVSTGLFLFRYI